MQKWYGLNFGQGGPPELKNSKKVYTSQISRLNPVPWSWIISNDHVIKLSQNHWILLKKVISRDPRIVGAMLEFLRVSPENFARKANA